MKILCLMTLVGKNFLSKLTVFINKKAKAVLPSLFLLLLFANLSCEYNSMSMVSIQGQTMGTTYSVKLVGPESMLPNNEDLVALAEETFTQINLSMSTYLPDSELSLLNTSSEPDWKKVSPHLFDVLELSQSVSELSQGSFDVTVGPLVNLWGFGPEMRPETIPDEEQLNLIRSQIGYQNLQLDQQSQSVKKAFPGLSMDLSAVAKGYAVDLLARKLVEMGFINMMVEVGGELMLVGRNQKGKKWTIGIETPNYNVLDGQKAATQTVKISNKGMATSGDYRNYYEHDGVRYSHTIDPATGKPVTHNLASVTVISDDCASADALATAFSVMGAQKAMAVAETEKIAVYMIIANEAGFEAKHSKAFKKFLGKK